ncbi:S46 family peptidase [Pseudaquidulcibacter saccharophilus]|uniref:S46 family peptidase n=1 Tax=Pseudaquidulcibacter saccharophilus TaxID=2831900 RepID=UPI001EFF1769|nr:S46 family peptidase [Pseudaquidulcibacter saccharophilus]
MKQVSASLAIIAFALLSATYAKADEGMWTFDNFPSDKVEKEYGFKPTKEWLNNIQNSAVRLSSGCSASFVSENGLILTNWHCSAECTANLTTKENDYSKDGFFAYKREDEKQCPGMEAQVLEQIIDVTPTIKSAIAGLPQDKISSARNAAISKAEEDACKGLDTNKYHCDLVTLYRGGEYKIYKYRNYNDVRLVFEPEYAVGFFGGDPDNFNFPRYNLDSSFLRAYENGKPVKSKNFLKWTTDVPKEGELVFVAGNPGSTQRLKTVKQLEFNRDQVLPVQQLVRSELRGRLTEYVNQSDDNRREAGDLLFGIENSFKARFGQMRALSDPEFFAIKVNEEKDLRAKVDADPALKAKIGNPWADIEKATAKQQDLYQTFDFLEARPGSISSLYSAARMIVRAADEAQKPAAERLPGYSAAGLKAIEHNLMAKTPVYKDQEIMGLETWLSKTREYLTVDDANVKTLLGKESPEALARRLINNTKLEDLDYRKKLLDGGKAAVYASDDPLIQFVIKTDPQARAIREKYMAEVDGPMSAAAEKIAQARFAVYGNQLYPDATFTLRLSYGKIQGWTYNGVTVPPYTKMGGAYERATGSFPFEMAPKWLAKEDKINKDVVFDMSSNNDIIGGNSGSPMIDKQGRVVGAVFDGNIHSLGGDFAFDPRLNRAVTVSTAAITEALKNIYGLDYLVKELGAK